MPFPAPDLQPTYVHEPPAVTPDFTRTDVLWNRPVFKAPPLVVTPPKFDVDLFSSDRLTESAPLAS